MSEHFALEVERAKCAAPIWKMHLSHERWLQLEVYDEHVRQIGIFEKRHRGKDHRNLFLIAHHF